MIAAALPLRAQRSERQRRIAFLVNDPTIPATPAGKAFVDGLAEKGLVEGNNVVIDRRFAEGRIDAMPALVDELIRLHPDVIVVSSTAAAVAAHRATRTLPIVVLNVFDPVASGLAASLAAPGGNVTGLVNQVSAQMGAKRLEILHDAIPRASQIAVLVNFDLEISRAEWSAMTRAAPSLGLALRSVQVRQVSELPEAFAEIGRQRAQALLMTQSSALLANRRAVIALAAEHRLPAMYPYPDIARDGGLMGYGASRPESFRRAAHYAAAILGGAKPGELPIEQPTKFELVINVRTAKALGLAFSREFLLLRADEVIQ